MDHHRSLSTKRRPPRLTTSDRTISVAVDNYVPVPVSAITIEKSPVLGFEKIFYMGRSTGSIDYDDYQPQFVRKPALKRSDTLGVHSSTMYEMKKTHSFHANDPHTVEIQLTPSPSTSKRTSSMRHSSVYPNEFKIVDAAAAVATTSNDPQWKIAVGKVMTDARDRRNCKMHRSFHDPTVRKPVVEQRNKDVIIETVKCHSLGDEDIVASGGSSGEVTRKLVPKFNSANVSLESDVFRSRSNSRNQLADSHDDILHSPRKPSTESLDKEYSFKRGAKNAQSVYLHPNSFEEINVQRSFQDKRQHSASMRNRPYREPLGTTKKSKSFISETRRDYERSPRRRDSTIFTTEDARRSPRLSSNLLVPPDSIYNSDSRKSSNKDISEMDYDAIVRVYQQSQRKTSMLSLDLKGSVKKPIADGLDTDECDALHRKRKKIMCIIVTVFLSLVFASVFVVVFTLTHSVDTQVHTSGHTKKVYTFSRDRDMPIHYNGKFFMCTYIYVFCSEPTLRLITDF